MVLLQRLDSAHIHLRGLQTFQEIVRSRATPAVSGVRITSCGLDGAETKIGDSQMLLARSCNVNKYVVFMCIH